MSSALAEPDSFIRIAERMNGTSSEPSGFVRSDHRCPAWTATPGPNDGRNRVMVHGEPGFAAQQP
jgi:hypothetical protein